MSEIVATWSISLDCKCPCCGKYVDLTDYEDFWVDTHLYPGEHGTSRADNYEAVCPECDTEFTVKCEY